MRILLGPLLGGLSHHRANMWARADAPAQMHVWLAAGDDVSEAKYLGAADLLPENGHAGVFPLSKLKPETRYYYAVSLKKKLPPKKEFHAFTTFPKPGAKKTFQFMFGSCYRPADEKGGETFAELRRRVEADELRFGLFLGDQIYADAVKHNGLGRVAVTLDEYRKVYEHNWSTPAMRAFLPSLPLFMILDDHEVDDDWRWRDPSRQWADISILQKFIRWLKGCPPQERHLSAERVRAALKAYDERQALHAPDLLLPFETDVKGEFVFREHDPASLAYTFYYGNAAFFVLDTRAMRVRGRKRTMLGEGQWHVLKKWLREVKRRFYRAFPNFGVVKVDFDSPEPAVAFTLRYRRADGWKSVSITA